MIGRRLGVYQIGSLLGSGGMGDVYRAHDTRLGRDVAIKVLPEALAADPERLARFERESRVLASLNDPHIAAIYGVEEGDGVRALVLELVDGPTLAERIAAGPVPLDEAMGICRQIVDALDAAHELGIVHRDLKPANIKLRHDGTVKVLDFGLAKALDPGADALDLSNSPTLLHTGARGNVILGTAAYMAPEQAKGTPVDRRADVWALGCVLYEMLAGRRAFKGDDVTDTLASVLRDEPDWSALPSNTPPAIRRLLRRALIKNKRDRLGDLSAIRLEIDEALTPVAAGVATPGPARGAPAPISRRWIAGVTTAAAIIAAAMSGYMLRPPTPEGPRAFSILPPEGTTFASVEYGGAPALSPDGRQIAFVAEGQGGRLLWVRTIDAFDARPLAGTEGATAPFWSPDGRWLAFVAGTELKKISVAGGPPQVVSDGPGVSGLGALPGAWLPNDRILFYRSNRIFSVPAGGGQAVAVTERNVELYDENVFGPSLLGDGRHYIILVRGGLELEFQLCVGELGSNQRRVLLRGVTAGQYAAPRAGGPAHLLFVRNGRLMAQPFDEQRMMVSGSEVLVADRIGMSGGGALGDFSVSAGGALAYRRAATASHELAWYDRAGKQLGTIGDRQSNPRNNLRLSPDGRSVAFTRQGNEGTQDIWIADLSSGASSRFTLNGGRSPVWSPDGAFIAYLRGDTVLRKPLRGGAEVTIWRGPNIGSVNDWSGDNRYLLITRWDSKAGIGGRGLWLLPAPLDDGAKREPVFIDNSGIHGQFVPSVGSPKWISYDGLEGAGIQVFVRTLPGAQPGKWQVSPDGGNGTRWRRDGREVYFTTVGYGSLTAIEVEPGDVFRGGPPKLLPLPRAIAIAVSQYSMGYDVAADGQRFLAGFLDVETPAPAITVVTNWRSSLSK